MLPNRRAAEQEQKAKIRIRKFGESWCVWWNLERFASGRWFREWKNVEQYVRDQLRVAKASSFDIAEQANLFCGPH